MTRSWRHLAPLIVLAASTSAVEGAAVARLAQQKTADIQALEALLEQ
jgi:hypothetical protein